MSLPTLLTVAQFSEGTFNAAIGPEWRQGRTAYGGASAAIALAAVKAAYSGLPPLRSAQIAFVGPLGGSVAAVPTLLRRGKNSAFVGCDVTSEDGIGLRALFLFMTPRASIISYANLETPSHTSPQNDPIDTSGWGRSFMDRFELAIAGKPSDGFLRWARLRERSGLDPEIELIAIADALPPAAMALAPRWGPISTTTWQLNLATDAPATTDGWWLLGSDSLHAQNGASSQSMTIWNRNGSPIATATQSVALFI